MRMTVIHAPAECSSSTCSSSFPAEWLPWPWQNFVRGQEPPKCTQWTSPGETAKHRAEFWLTSVERCRCSSEAKTQHCWKLLGCSKLANRSQPLVGRSSHIVKTWRRYCCLAGFFSDCGARMANFWWCILYFQWAACSIFQTCILNLH